MKGNAQAEAIKQATILCQTLCSLTANSKGLTRMIGTDSEVDNLVASSKKCITLGRTFYDSLQSAQLLKQTSTRDECVRKGLADFQASLAPLVQLVALMVRAPSAGAKADSDDLLELEMANAARSIEEASARLIALMAESEWWRRACF